MSPGHYLALSAILFTIGALGVLVRRNALVVFMCIELMLNATTRRSSSVDDANLLKY